MFSFCCCFVRQESTGMSNSSDTVVPPKREQRDPPPVEGAVKVRRAIRFFAQMFLRSEDFVVLEALIQAEEDRMGSGVFEGATLIRIAEGLQVQERMVEAVLRGLERDQVILSVQPPKLPPPKRKSKAKKEGRKGGSGTPVPTTADGEQGNISDRGSSVSSDQTVASSSSSSGDSEFEDRAQKTAQAEAQAVRYFVNYRTALPLALWSFRRTYALLCSHTIPPREAHGGATGTGIGTGTVGAKGLLCPVCDSHATVERLRLGSRCPSCDMDLVVHSIKEAALARTNRGQRQAPSECPPLLQDDALLAQGLTWVSLFTEPFVALQDEKIPLSAAEDILTVSELKAVSEHAFSSVALKYRTVPSIPVQIVSLQQKEDESKRRIANKQRRQAHQPPWLALTECEGRRKRERDDTAGPGTSLTPAGGPPLVASHLIANGTGECVGGVEEDDWTRISF